MKDKRIWLVILGILVIGILVTGYTRSVVKKQADTAFSSLSHILTSVSADVLMEYTLDRKSVV